MSSTAAIINSIESYAFAKNNLPEVKTIISDNYLTYKLSKDSKCKYFFEFIEQNAKDNNLFLIDYLILNWYRDIDGKDILFNNGISIGQILSRRLIFGFVMDLKNYDGLRYWLLKYNKIYVPNNISKSMKRVVSAINNDFEFEWYYPDQKKSKFIESTPERAIYYNHPVVHPFSGLAKKIQKPFLSIVRKKKILYLNDWSSQGLAKMRNDLLSRNNYNFLKSYYFKKVKNIPIEEEFFFPIKIDNNKINISHLETVMKEIGITWDRTSYNLFLGLANNEYEKNRSLFIKIFYCYKSLFEYYKPNSVIFSGENEFHTVIVSQLSKIMKIKRYLLVDGYTSYHNETGYFKDEKNQNFIFDKFFAQGKAAKDLFNSIGIPNKDCIIIEPPIISPQKKNIKKISKESPYPIILGYIPHANNYNASLDKTIDIESDIIFLLYKMGYNKVGIKQKMASWGQHETLDLYYEIMKRKFGEKFNIDIKIIQGVFYKCLKDAKFFVGGISSAIIESYYSNIPFYIYEPFENGKTDQMINSSMIYDLSTIARNINQLDKMIKDRKQSIQSNKNYIFSGPSFEKINID